MAPWKVLGTMKRTGLKKSAKGALRKDLGALHKDVGEHFGGPKRGQRSPKNQTKMHPNFDGGFDRVLGALWAPEWYQHVGKKLSKNDSDLDHFFV